MDFPMFRPAPALLLALVAAAALPACKTGTGGTKKVATEEVNQADPGPSYRNGLATLKAGEGGGKVDYEAALRHFEEAVQIAETNGTPNAKYYYNAAWTAERLGQDSKSEGWYRKALGVDAAMSQASQNLAYLYIRNGRAAEAADLFRQALDRDPKSLNIKNNYAAALGEAGQYDQAVSTVYEILAQDAENVQAYKTLSRIYFLQGNHKMSRLASGDALKKNDKDADIHNNIALTFLKEGNEGAAVEEFKKAIELDAGNVEANLNLGFLALDSGDYQLAGKCFNTVIGVDPGSTDAHIGLAVAYRGNQSFDEAVAEYDRVLGVDPKNKTALLNKAIVQNNFLDDQKSADKTLADFERFYPSDPALAEVKAKIDRRKSEKDEAARMLAEMERLEKERAERYTTQSALATKRIGTASAMLEKYRTLVPDESFNEVLQQYIDGVKDALEVEDLDYLTEAVTYLDEFVRDQYVPGEFGATIGEYDGTAPTAPTAPPTDPAAGGTSGTEGGAADPAAATPAAATPAAGATGGESGTGGETGAETGAGGSDGGAASAGDAAPTATDGGGTSGDTPPPQ